MPTYELTCRSCGHAFEKFLLRLVRDEDLVCPECGSSSVQKGLGGGVFKAGRSMSAASIAPSCGDQRFG